MTINILRREWCIIKEYIGVIDSGVGGLTVLKELINKMPSESYIYLGDTLNCPYGDKSKFEVLNNIWHIINKIDLKKLKCLVIACNTATAYALENLKDNLKIPIIGVIKPGVKAALNATQNNQVAVIATRGTIDSGVYKKHLLNENSQLKIFSLACPLFAPMVEKGIINGVVAQKKIEESLYSIKSTRVDTLILGCTHFPIIQHLIQDFLGFGVEVVSSGFETANEVYQQLKETDKLNYTEPNQYKNDIEFFVSGEIQPFFKLMKIILNKKYYNNYEMNFSRIT